MNPFSVLGITENSTEDERKKAYRKLCAKYHPDNPSGDADKFDMVQKAWNMINNKQAIKFANISKKYLEHIDLFHFRVVS